MSAMNPDTRMAISLLLSLALSATNLRMAAAGQADIVVVGIRYVVGFVICFMLVGVVGRLFNAYLNQTAMVRGGAAMAADDDQTLASADT